MDISKLFRLTKERIERQYQHKPIYILDNEKNIGNWYIYLGLNYMPPHLLSTEEYDLEEDETECLCLCGDGGNSYAMLRYIDSGEIEAYGYE